MEMNNKPVPKREFVGIVPDRIKRLPVDERGFPVPKFTAWKDGVPDFRAIDEAYLHDAYRNKKCWICGEPLGVFKCFVVGPMCCVNRVSAEPPSHSECAKFAALNCPFLSKPLAKRADLSDLEKKKAPAGTMIPRNPGVSAVWTTRSFHLFAATGGVLFEIGNPETIDFYSRSRRATLEELDESVRTGLPILRKAAKSEGAAAVKKLEGQIAAFETLKGRFIV